MFDGISSKEILRDVPVFNRNGLSQSGSVRLILEFERLALISKISISREWTFLEMNAIERSIVSKPSPTCFPALILEKVL
jgi:hypothetical protein